MAGVPLILKFASGGGARRANLGIGTLAKATPFLHTGDQNKMRSSAEEIFGAIWATGGNRWDFSFDLVINALIAGILLGGFYAAVTVGVSISFGILDIVNIAHPAFIILGSYIAYIVNTRLGIDPILVSVVMLPVFYVLGAGIYQVYYASFEKHGQDALRGLAFFFGLLFITEVMLILVFGVDYRYVEAPYIGPTWHSA